MNPTVHHVVEFPDCRLEFDYPSDLRPSTDFMSQLLSRTVNYETIRWLGPSASDKFIKMHADLEPSPSSGALATVSIEMWLCAAPDDFSGDVRDVADLRRANLVLDEREHRTVSELSDLTINGRPWLYRASGRNFITGLNRRVYVSARVSVVGATGHENARAFAAALRDQVIGSLRVTALVSTATAPAFQP